MRPYQELKVSGCANLILVLKHLHIANPKLDQYFPVGDYSPKMREENSTALAVKGKKPHITVQEKSNNEKETRRSREKNIM